ncbi:MAG: hypothetical protein U5P41_09635 [Gammaproteobacteria bacterium]|nr:hypothetical protein [Gammaproteobacteria bacterium]
MILNGPVGNYTFIVDSGFVGAGPSVFDGGTMDLQNSTITIYGASQAQVSGSAVPDSQVFSAWNGSPFTPLVAFAVDTVFFKAPPPQGEIKDEKNIREDYEGDILVAYEGSDPDIQAGDRGGRSLPGDITGSSYTQIGPYAVDYFFFGQEIQSPVEGLMPAKLVDRTAVNQ